MSHAQLLRDLFAFEEIQRRNAIQELSRVNMQFALALLNAWYAYEKLCASTLLCQPSVKNFRALVLPFQKPLEQDTDYVNHVFWKKLRLAATAALLVQDLESLDFDNAVLMLWDGQTYGQWVLSDDSFCALGVDVEKLQADYRRIWAEQHGIQELFDSFAEFDLPALDAITPVIKPEPM